MTRDEWLRRYEDRIVAVARVERKFAHAAATADTFEVLSEDYEDDPEGAADMEMSYWDGI